MNHYKTIAAIAFLTLVITTGGNDANAQDVSKDQQRDTTTEMSKDQVKEDMKPAIRLLDEAYAKRDADQAFLRFRRNIERDAKLAEGGLGNQERLLWRYHHDGGNHLAMRRTVQLATRADCKGPCFEGILGFVAKARAAGAGSQTATNMSMTALRDERRERRRDKTRLSDEQLAKNVQSRLENRLRAWQQERTQASNRALMRDATRDRERAKARNGDQDRDADRAQDRDRDRDRDADRDRDRDRDADRDRDRDRDRDGSRGTR